MNIFLTTLIQYLAEILVLIIITGLGLLGTQLLAKMGKNKNLTNITLATQQVIAAVQETVKELQQTLVNNWKENQNGRLTPDQIKTLQNELLAITLSKLSKPTLGLLEGAKVDIIAMISSAAESFILTMKYDNEG